MTSILDLYRREMNLTLFNFVIASGMPESQKNWIPTCSRVRKVPANRFRLIMVNEKFDAHCCQERVQTNEM